MITEFTGDYDFLDNHYIHNVLYENMIFPSNENAFQAMKTFEPEIRKLFTTASVDQVKTLGRCIVLRPDWEDVKENIMYEIIKASYTQDPVLREKLLATGNDIIVYGNDHDDNYWGFCNCIKCKNIVHNNKLGKIIMRVRDEFNNN